MLLDFDGVLSDFAPTPDEALMSESLRRNLKSCAKRIPTAIISGRALADIKKKVGLKNVSYSGNHGLEWQFGDKRFSAPQSPAVAAAVAEFKKILPAIFRRYPGTFLENKRLTLAVHYRKLTPPRIFSFVREIMRVVRPLALSGGLFIEHNKKTIELRPKNSWNKGTVSLFLFKKLAGKKRSLPIYIGDSLTDEDAFLALKNIGLTIRVGKNIKSVAMYYLRSRSEVDEFISRLSSII